MAIIESLPVSTPAGGMAGGGVDFLKLITTISEGMGKFMTIINQVKEMQGQSQPQQQLSPLPRGYVPPPNPNPNMSQIAQADHKHEPAACDVLLFKAMNSLKSACDAGLGNQKVFDLLKLKGITLDNLTLQQIYDMLMKL